MSFAAHAAIALENARLFERDRRRRNRQVAGAGRPVEVAAHAHDRLTDVLLHGGGVADVAEWSPTCSTAPCWCSTARDTGWPARGGDDLLDGLDDAVAEARASGRCVPSGSTGRPTSPWRWPAPSTSARCCCTARPPSSARRPAHPRARAPSSPRWCCCSTARWPRPRSGCAGSCSADLLERRDLDESPAARAGAVVSTRDLEGPASVAVARGRGRRAAPGGAGRGPARR